MIYKKKKEKKIIYLEFLFLTLVLLVTVFSWTLMVNEKTAFKCGSSMHGNARRAYVGEN